MYPETGSLPSPYGPSGLADCAKSNRQPSAREQLNRRKADLEEQLKDVNAAIQALDDHPDVEKVLTLVGRTVRF